MAPAAQPDSAPASFELKSSSLALESLLLKTADWQLLAQDLERQFGPLGESPDFFDFDGLIVDVSQVPADQTVGDLATLNQLLQRFKLLPVALRGGSADLLAQAQAIGWAQASPEVSRGKPAKAQDVVQQVTPDAARAQAPAQVHVQAPTQSSISAASSTAAKPAMVVDKPLRSGQKIYAKGCDLIVLAMVNQGAEVVADGNIHVYATLRGKAMAGASGNTAARIFALSLEPELISIAGVYRTSENKLPDNVHAKPAQVRLHSSNGSDKLLIEPLKA
jgi:septum site-determining protein MinC